MVSKEYPWLYRRSAADAKELGELEQWHSSHAENIRCKNAIEDSIRAGFDGMHLKDSCAAEIIEEYGFKRTGWVLANTVQQKMYDGRFHPQCKDWATGIYIPEDRRHNDDFVVESHPTILDGFIREYLDEIQKLDMFSGSHCETLLGKELEGKVLVLSMDALKEKYWAPQNQLWLAEGGFGCQANAAGRAVFATCLGDGEKTRWNRGDFIGILKEEFMPDWAKKKLEEYLNPSQGLDINMN